MHTRLLRIIALLVAVLLVASGCSGSSDEVDAAGDDAAATADPAIEPAETSAQSVEDDAAYGGDPSLGEPVLVEQIAAAMLGGEPLSPEASTCLADAAASVADFADALAVVQAAETALSDEAFASLVVNVRTCVGAEAHDRALSLGVTLGEQREEVETCLASALAADDGNAALVALQALVLNVGISPEAQEPAATLLAGCVPDDVLAQQFAGSYEQRNGAVLVDVECLTEAFGGISSIEAFWGAFLLTGEAEILAEADELAAGCADDPNADLLQELPEDFEPWSGTGALAAVTPAARNDAYSEPPPMTIDPDGSYQAIITTAAGEMVIDLFADTAPVTVNNFVALARDGFYDRTTFHRVLSDFMAQGGDPTGSGTGGPGYLFEDELDGGPAMDRRGLLAMANGGPDTNGGQFFITLAPAEHLTGVHTIFGELVEGDDVLGAVDLRDPENPVGRAEVIESIRIVEG